MTPRLMLSLTLVPITFAGCSRNAVMLPNSDGSLNKSATTFATEAAARFPYPSDLPRGGELPARAEIGYMWNVINLVSFAQQDLSDVELWVNKSYVLPFQKLEPRKAKQIAFKMIYNDKGQHLPEEGVMIESLELKLNGKLYDVPKQIGG